MCVSEKQGNEHHLVMAPARDGQLIPDGGPANVVVSPGLPSHGT